MGFQDVIVFLDLFFTLFRKIIPIFYQNLNWAIITLLREIFLKWLGEDVEIFQGDGVVDLD